MESMLTLFGAPLTRYGCLAALGLGLTLAVALWRCLRARIPYGAFVTMAACGVPLCWLCSRLFFVLASYGYYLVELGDASLALRFWDGGYSITGAYVGLLLAAVAAHGLTRQPFGKLADALALGMPLGLMVARLAERGTGLGEGQQVPENWPALLSIDTEYGLLHAVCVYEAVAAALIFVVLLAFQRARKRRDGDLLLLFTLLYGCSQVVLESLRVDGHMTVHMGVSVQQVLCAVMAVTVLILWITRAARAHRIPPLQLTLTALESTLAVIFAIIAEFGVDRWESKPAAYALMTLCMLDLLITALLYQRKTTQEAHP